MRKIRGREIEPRGSTRRSIRRRSVQGGGLVDTLLSGVILLALVTVAAWGVWAVPPPPQPQAPIAGFPAASSQSEQQWEQKFRASPSPDNLRDYMKLLSARPHHVGSPYDKQNAEWIAAKFKEWGWDAHMETSRRPFPHAQGTPGGNDRRRRTSPPSCRSRALPGDPTSSQQAEQLPTYNAYSIDGDVTAPLVYVNYGVPDDYEQLARHGHFREGRDRDRALRRLLARHQAQSCRRTWRGGLPDLFRSARRRILSKAKFFRTARGVRRDGVQRGSVHGHARLSWRSADAGRGRHRGRQASAI